MWKTHHMCFIGAWGPWAGSAPRLSAHAGLFTCNPGLGGAADGEGQDLGQLSPWESLRAGGQFTVRGTPCSFMCPQEDAPFGEFTWGVSRAGAASIRGPTPSFSDWPPMLTV